MRGKYSPGTPIPEIERRTANLLQEGSGGPHVVNLGHGILPMIPVDHARAFVEAVKRGQSNG